MGSNLTYIMKNNRTSANLLNSSFVLFYLKRSINFIKIKFECFFCALGRNKFEYIINKGTENKIIIVMRNLNIEKIEVLNQKELMELYGGYASPSYGNDTSDYGINSPNGCIPNPFDQILKKLGY